MWIIKFGTDYFMRVQSATHLPVLAKEQHSAARFRSVGAASSTLCGVRGSSSARIVRLVPKRRGLASGAAMEKGLHGFLRGVFDEVEVRLAGAKAEREIVAAYIERHAKIMGSHSWTTLAKDIRAGEHLR